MIVQFRNEKLVIMALYRSPLTVTRCGLQRFEEGFHQPIKRTKQSSFLDATVFSTYTCGLASLQMRQFLFVDMHSTRSALHH
ncbi:hypothetical protein TNCV_2689211 [Trichonephila clavipes]|nr:hypothetical protein TNCV_2689211 [Trichonephila clavipes]